MGAQTVLSRTPIGRAWQDRGWVLVGRGATGVLPLALLALASRSLGLAAMGTYASALALAAGLVEIADVASQRHIPRLISSGARPDRVEGYHAIRWLLLVIGALPAFLVSVTSSDPALRAPSTAVLLATVPMLGINTSYARALAAGRYEVLGLGPLVGLVTSITVTVALVRTAPWLGLWGPTLGLVLGKSVEWVVTRPSAVRRSHGPVFKFARAEWPHVRYLVLQALLSAANARLVVPFVALLGGPAGAGLLSVGISVLSVVSLVATAFAVPAYRAALSDEAPIGPAQAFSRVRRDWWHAQGVGVLLTGALLLSVPYLVRMGFRVDARSAWVVGIIVGAGLFETASAFVGTLYHASFRDRTLFHFTAINTLVGWLLVGAAVVLAGPEGMAWGFLVSRAVGALVLHLPLLGFASSRSSGSVSPLVASRAVAARVLLASTQDALSPGPRYRVFQFLPHLAAAGCQYTVMTMQGENGTRRAVRAAGRTGWRRVPHLVAIWLRLQAFQVSLLLCLPRFERVMLYRVPISSWARPLFRLYRSRLIFDFDDALYDAEASPGSILSAIRRRMLRKSLANGVGIASRVVTSNETNAEFARRLGAEVRVIPTSVDTTRVRFRSRRDLRRPPVLGWIGTPSTALYLPLIETALREMVTRHGVTIRLVGAGSNPFRTLEPELHEWALISEAEDLDQFDVGLMPMPDTAWTRGKAALKALQYGACGIPTVASWTPTNEAILGTTGGALLCRTEGEWVTALDRLLSSADLRARLGAAGRDLVAAHYSVQANGGSFVNAVLAPTFSPTDLDGPR